MSELVFGNSALRWDFPFENSPKNPDPSFQNDLKNTRSILSYMMDLDIWYHFGREKLWSYV